MTKKELSRKHEDYIARLYDGKRSAASGASDTNKADVRTDEVFYECKLSGAPGGPPKNTTLLRVMEKAADEAWSEGRAPAVCLRLFNPTSPLADLEGWVDMTVRLTADDSERERSLGDQAR